MAPFLKKQTCPSTETLLDYSREALSPLDGARVSAHVTACDFCGAEVQLLAHHPTAPEAVAPIPIPPAMEELATRLLAEHVHLKMPRQRRAA